MREAIAAAAREGLVLGVKWGIALVVVLFLVTWFLGDYAIIRERARNGQLAYEVLSRQAAAAQTATSSPPTAQQEK